VHLHILTNDASRNHSGRSQLAASIAPTTLPAMSTRIAPPGSAAPDVLHQWVSPQGGHDFDSLWSAIAGAMGAELGA
jgi:hypothetical protein